MKNIRFYLLAFVALLVFVGCTQTATDRVDGEKNSRDSGIHSLSFTNYAGEEVSLKDFEGKPYVANAWAGWCTFCKKELVDFAAVQRDFPDVPIIAINRGESLKKAKGFSDELGVTDDLQFWLDPKDTFYRAIGGFSMPETIFVDASGKILFHKRGVMDAEEFRMRIQELITTSTES